MVEAVTVGVPSWNDPAIPASGVVSGVANVQNFGAVGNGIADDTAAINRALAALSPNGGTLLFTAPGPYKTTSTLTLQSSNLIVEGNGATILFSPTPPLTPSVNDRAFAVYGTTPGPFNLAAGTAGAIALGATSFLAANAADAATLQPNDWVILQEKDTGQSPAEVYFYDQYQVASVAGTTVNLYHKVRTAFPGTHSTIQFYRISKLTQNVTIRNLTLQSTFSSATLPAVVGIFLGQGARTIVVDNVVVNMPTGNAIASYLTADLKIVNSTFNSGNLQSSEFASTVDMAIDNSIWDAYNQAPSRPPLTIDFGTAFSNFSNNVIRRAANFGLGLFYGVHDCSIVGNTVGWVSAIGTGVSGVGISGVGCYNNVVAGNTLIGADGGSSTGISFSSDNGAIPAVVSSGNRTASNRIGPQFVFPTGIEAAPGLGLDTYLELTTLSNTPLIKIGRALQLVDTAGNSPFIRLSTTSQEWNIGQGAGLVQFSDVTNGAQAVQIAPTTAPAINLYNWSALRRLFTGFRSTVATDYTPNPIPAQGISTFAISVPGTLVGDMVALGTSAVPPGCTWIGWASANDTVTVQITNPTASPVTPVPATWHAVSVALS